MAQTITIGAYDVAPTHIISQSGGGVAAIGPAAYIANAEAIICNSLRDSRNVALVGNSGGGLNVAMMCIGMRGDDMTAMHDKHCEGIFSERSMLGRAQLEPKWKDDYFMDLAKSMFPMTLGSLKGKHIYITAWDAVKRDIKVFSSEDTKDADVPLWYAVRASMAAPTYFEPVGPYYDGGLCCNDPAVVGADALRYRYGKDLCLKVAQFVTSGKQPDSPMPKQGMSSVKTLTSVVLPAVTQGNSAHVNYSLKANGHDVFRIMPEHRDYGLDDPDFVPECVSYWDKEWLDNGRNFINWWMK